MNNKIGPEIVQIIVRRDFHESDVEIALRLLEQYGEKAYHAEKHRTHLSILKLSNGNLRELERMVKVACVDFRDVGREQKA